MRVSSRFDEMFQVQLDYFLFTRIHRPEYME